MDNLEQDFVSAEVCTDARGVKRRTKLNRLFHGNFGKWTEEQNERLFGINRAARFNKSALEVDLAHTLKRDMHTAEWIADIAELENCGLLIVQRKKWDGVKTCTFVELPDEEKTIRLSGRGEYFASMNFSQAMQMANERVTSVG